jgi:hypothetical protein
VAIANESRRDASMPFSTTSTSFCEPVRSASRGSESTSMAALPFNVARTNVPA